MATVTIAGGAKLQAAMAKLKKKMGDKAMTVRVGFLEGATYPDGTTVATIAAIQNFGAPARGVPPRPFFTKMIADNRGRWGDSFATVLHAVDYDPHLALERMGLGISGQLRQAIVDMNDPANSPVTALLKERFPTRDGMTFADVLQARHDVASGVASGSYSKPLVWSGVMLNAISSEVVDGDGGAS